MIKNNQQSQQVPMIKVSVFEEEERENQAGVLEQQKKNVRYLAFCYLTLFIAFNSTQNLVSSLYKEQGYEYLGLTSLLFIYIVFAVVSLLAKNIIARYQYHHIFALSALGYSSFVLCGIWVCSCTQSQDQSGQSNQQEYQVTCSSQFIYLIVIICSSLCGACSSFLWVGQGGYMDNIFSLVKSEKGTISGIFWSIRQSSHIIGNMAAMIILNWIDNTIYFFIIMGIVSLSASVMFYFIAKVEQPHQNIRHSDLEKSFIPNNQTQIPPISVTVNKVFILMRSLKFQPFLFFTILSGIIVAFSSGFQRNLVKASVEEDEKVVAQSLTYVLICFGIFEYVGGKISGRLADRINVYYLATIGTLIILFGLLVCLIGLLTKSYVICFVIGSIFGFSDCYLNNISQIITNTDYKGQLEVFQAQRFVFSMANAFTQVMLLLLTSMPDYTFLTILFIIALFANFVVSLFPQLSKLDINTTIYSTKAI